MLNQYGFEGHQWDAAKNQAKTILVEVASRRGRIAYSELVHQISSLHLEPHDSRLFHLLGEISTEEDKAGRGMLTAIVVHKTGDMQPGPGFFELAKSLGRNTKDSLECWIKEFNRVHDYWANKNRRA
jgi:molybdopterin synthase catalytic subunit